jgi:transcriptional regulator with XRE-family HTH domain
MVEDDVDRAFHAALSQEVQKRGHGTKAFLADQTGLTRTYITRLVKKESGSETTRRKIARAFGYEYEQFLTIGRSVIGTEGELFHTPAKFEPAISPTGVRSLKDLASSLSRTVAVDLSREEKREMKYLLDLTGMILTSNNERVREALKSNIVAFAEMLDSAQRLCEVESELLLQRAEQLAMRKRLTALELTRTLPPEGG